MGVLQVQQLQVCLVGGGGEPPHLLQFYQGFPRDHFLRSPRGRHKRISVLEQDLHGTHTGGNQGKFQRQKKEVSAILQSEDEKYPADKKHLKSSEFQA